ncbi:WhiB family redox-sensing transcriptional regulator [Saccharopolyspora erythraea NRRL 2338]|uniref:Uncharacterized protein n=2 Tax=Saccharopolyspora erythraea TaxID=1836 RepID=A4FMA9_SACEN|nr:WhiB family transcriptional regulator [Saccharopolyspora erythraea]PFG98824.1 WhiB family redox-sensing transcriptional regulator [Saccharopolyspora erythraea NRRL 2338]QRK88821.1 WhiB family transcriptional regulator [Saccharopolyspora erythraea]CAM05184.1 hypothetical protein SACE_6004 [Saccharopolyspora erythraea NRRL 2338]
MGEVFPLEIALRGLALVLWGAGERPEWHSEAACREANRDWFGDSTNPAERARRIDHARRVCALCPVRVECLRDAVGWESRSTVRAREAVGVLGGMSAAERRELYRRLPGLVGVGQERRRRRC